MRHYGLSLYGRHNGASRKARMEDEHGTSNENRTGADVKEEKNGMKKGTYDIVMFQHKTEALNYAMWSDNNIVRTLSNFHSPEILSEGLKRKRKVDGVRECAQTPVPCPKQNKDYSETFHLIDKGNGAEVKYHISLESHKYGWTPKLLVRYFNMNLNNAYKVYCSLVDTYTPGKRYHKMGDAVDEAAHAFL